MDEGRQRTAATDVAVVIIHWNQADRLRATLEHFARQSIAAEVVIVDNGSSKAALSDIRAVLAEQGSTIDVLEQGRNIGFGPAGNVGLRHWLAGSDCEFLVVAPHDALPAPDCLQRMVAEFRSRPTAGLACADVGDGVTPYINPYLGGVGIPATLEEGWEPADFPHGTLFMGRRRCLEEIGLFDERYFAYGEEVEIGLRARRARWEVGLVRGARVVNPTMRLGSQAVDYLMQRNTLVLVREMSGRAHSITRLAIALYGLLRGVVRPSTRSLLFAPRARLLGIAHYLRGRHGAPPESYFEKLDERGEPLRRPRDGSRSEVAADKDWLLRRTGGQ